MSFSLPPNSRSAYEATVGPGKAMAGCLACAGILVVMGCIGVAGVWAVFEFSRWLF